MSPLLEYFPIMPDVIHCDVVSSSSYPPPPPPSPPSLARTLRHVLLPTPTAPAPSPPLQSVEVSSSSDPGDVHFRYVDNLFLAAPVG